MKKTPDEKLSPKETQRRERDVLNHFLSSPPKPHKPMGKNPQAKRRRKERRTK
jgi:hypothetical protein